ncbi:CAAX amino terminal protease self- immunity [Rhodobacteraceae bacterium THAF1]|nr:CAAX amino terminal protease self- immunity [Rhodobacteraceae bacterium THAF1]
MQQFAAAFRGQSGGAIMGGVICAMAAFAVLGVVISSVGLAPGTDPVSITLILCSYALPAVALLFWAGRKQGIEPGALFGPSPQVRMDAAIAARRVLASLGAIFALTILAIGLSGAIEPPDAAEAGRMRDAAPWLAALPFAAVAVLLQSGSEEVLFRGYLMPALRARSANPWVWLAGPAILFGMAHVPYAETWQDGAFLFIVTGLLGLALGDLTARTGSIGAAVGLHWAWNVWQFILFAEEGSPMSGYALFLQPTAPRADFGPLTLLAVALTILIPWLAIRLGLRR